MLKNIPSARYIFFENLFAFLSPNAMDPIIELVKAIPHDKLSSLSLSTQLEVTKKLFDDKEDHREILAILFQTVDVNGHYDFMSTFENGWSNQYQYDSDDDDDDMTALRPYLERKTFLEHDCSNVDIVSLLVDCGAIASERVFLRLIARNRLDCLDVILNSSHHYSSDRLISSFIQAIASNKYDMVKRLFLAGVDINGDRQNEILRVVVNTEKMFQFLLDYGLNLRNKDIELDFYKLSSFTFDKLCALGAASVDGKTLLYRDLQQQIVAKFGPQANVHVRDSYSYKGQYLTHQSISQVIVFIGKNKYSLAPTPNFEVPDVVIDSAFFSLVLVSQLH